MSLYTLAPSPWLIFLDDAGFFVPMGQLALYEAGTSTPATTYTSVGGVAHPFPITLDGTGRVPGGLYLQPGLSYKFVLHAPQIEAPLDGAIIKTQDHVGAVPSSGGALLTLNTPGDYSSLNVEGVSIIEYTGAADVHVRGLTGGVVGQTVQIRNLTNFVIWLYPQDPAAPSGGTLLNNFTIGPMPCFGQRSYVAYTYSSLRDWRVSSHAQGRPITPPYLATNYSAGGGGVSPTWGVEAADIVEESFYLHGRTLLYNFRYNTTSVAGAPSVLMRAMPFGWQAIGASYLNTILVTYDAGVTYVAGIAIMNGPTLIAFERLPVTTFWPDIANGVTLYGQLMINLN